jgi:hypothetical protein
MQFDEKLAAQPAHVDASLRAEKTERFRTGIRNVASSAEALLKAVRAGNHETLGLRLAAFLKDLRMQRSYCLDLGAGQPMSPEMQSFLDALSSLRNLAGQWLTLHGSQPRLLQQQASDFEMQCYAALGNGVLWIDSLRPPEALSQAPESRWADEQMLSSFFNSQPASAEDITEEAFTGWKEAHTQHGLIA